MSEPPELKPDANPAKPAPNARAKAPPRPRSKAKARPPAPPRPRPAAKPKRQEKPEAAPKTGSTAPTTAVTGPSPTNDAFIDRRAAPRFDLMAQIWVKHAELTFVMDVKNISESSILLEVNPQDTQPRWTRIGQNVELQLFLLDVGEDLLLQGAIARVEQGNEVEPTRFAVTFVALDEPTRTSIKGLLARASAGQPALAPPPIPTKA